MMLDIRCSSTTGSLRRSKNFKRTRCAGLFQDLVLQRLSSIEQGMDNNYLFYNSSLLQLLEVGARGGAREYQCHLCPCTQYDQRQGDTMMPMRRLKFCDFVDDIKYVGNHGNIGEYDRMDYIVKASSLHQYSIQHSS